MKSSLRLSFCLIASISTGTSLAQTSTAQTSENTEKTSSPVAYVYVSRPTHVDGFAASADGKLTPVKGSPFADITLSHLSVTKKFLFGPGDDGVTIYGYSIASDGALKKVSEIDSSKYHVDCNAIGPTQIDSKGTTLYNFIESCEESSHVESYKIEENGELQFLGWTGGGDYDGLSFGLLGNNNYAYFIGGNSMYGTDDFVFQRQSDGLLSGIDAKVAAPKPENPADVYSAIPVLAADSSDHVALILQPETNETLFIDGPPQLFSYTADSAGNLNTTNTYKDAPATLHGGTMSISPTGKLLAVGGADSRFKGFQVFHFDGGNPIKPYSGLLQSKTEIDQFGWDKSNHLYALGGGYLFVYTVTPTSIKEVAKYSIPEASSVIVLDLQ